MRAGIGRTLCLSEWDGTDVVEMRGWGDEGTGRSGRRAPFMQTADGGGRPGVRDPSDPRRLEIEMR